MVWHDVVWYGVAWYDMVLCGMVWCGVAWCGVVWHGVAWCVFLVVKLVLFQAISGSPPLIVILCLFIVILIYSVVM